MSTTTCQGAARQTSLCHLMMSLHTVHTVHTVAASPALHMCTSSYENLLPFSTNPQVSPDELARKSMRISSMLNSVGKSPKESARMLGFFCDITPPPTPPHLPNSRDSLSDEMGKLAVFFMDIRGLHTRRHTHTATHRHTDTRARPPAHPHPHPPTHTDVACVTNIPRPAFYLTQILQASLSIMNLIPERIPRESRENPEGILREARIPPHPQHLRGGNRE